RSTNSARDPHAPGTVPSTWHPPCDRRAPSQWLPPSSGLSSLTRLFGGLHLNRRKPLDPCAQVIGKHKRTATALECAQLARLDRLIGPRAAGARDDAALGDCVGQRFHFDPAT